mgnify:CR=1 FL=1
MATTTATITLASSDIGDNALSISNTSTLYTAGTNTGITETTGLARKKNSSGSNTILLDHGLAQVDCTLEIGCLSLGLVGLVKISNSQLLILLKLH